MSESLKPFPWLFERRLSGTARVFLAFVTGTLFALLPMYYVYTGRDAALESAPPLHAAAPSSPAQTAGAAGGEVSADAANGFAARMTYELSQRPEEPAALAVSRPGAAPSSESADLAASGGPSPRALAEERAATRIVNARPINTTPPEPRDTTREIEKEARRAEYRAPPPRATGKTGGDAQPRVVEGRDFVLPPKPAASTTRVIAPNPPIAAGSDIADAEPNRRMIESAVVFMAAPDRKQIESQSVIAGGPAVAGVTPIGPAPEAAQRAEAAAKVATASAVPDAPRNTASDVESRLAATREWLTAAPQTTHTIQILGTNSEEQLKAHLKTLSKVLEPSKLYVYRTQVQGKPAMTVVYGAYADRQAAAQALEKLPPTVSANRPVLRTVNGIRNELKQNGVKSEP